MGNPHAVWFTDEDIDTVRLNEIGPLVGNHPDFPNRTNFEIVNVLADDHLKMRVWERGVGETMACGTGACAVLVAAQLRGFAGRSATVSLPGGDLQIAWDGPDDPTASVEMTGPAEFAFEGAHSNQLDTTDWMMRMPHGLRLTTPHTTRTAPRGLIRELHENLSTRQITFRNQPLRDYGQLVKTTRLLSVQCDDGYVIGLPYGRHLRLFYEFDTINHIRLHLTNLLNDIGELALQHSECELMTLDYNDFPHRHYVEPMLMGAAFVSPDEVSVMRCAATSASSRCPRSTRT